MAGLFEGGKGRQKKFMHCQAVRTPADRKRTRRKDEKHKKRRKEQEEKRTRRKREREKKKQKKKVENACRHAHRKMNNPAVKRIMGELKELTQGARPDDHFVAAPMEDNLFEWHLS